MAVFAFIEFVLSSIGYFFNSIGYTIGSAMEWLSSAYPCTFRVIVMLFCLVVAFIPFIIAGIETTKK